MPRIYSNYSDDDYDMVTSLAKELGFSSSAFQHYCVMLYADKRGNTSPLNKLINTMLQTLNEMPNDTTFIVSSLVPEEWAGLSRSDKMSLAKQLSLFIKNNPTEYEKAKIVKGKTTLYRKK